MRAASPSPADEVCYSLATVTEIFYLEFPQLGDTPQSIINRQLVDDCDNVIGTFWTSRRARQVARSRSVWPRSTGRWADAGAEVRLGHFATGSCFLIKECDWFLDASYRTRYNVPQEVRR